MARAKKEAALTPEERLQAALVPDWEWPYKLPENWCWGYGKAIFEPMEVNRPSGDTFRYIDIDSIDNKQQIVSEPKILPVITAPSRASRKLHTGDTVFSMVRPYLKNIAYIDESISDAIASTGFYVCTPKEIVSSKYCYYLMTSSYVVDGLNVFMKGDNSPSIRKDDIEEFAYPLAPLAEQQRIVDRIESLFAKLDEAKEKAQTVLDSFETRKAAILHKAFTGELTAKWREEHGVGLESWENKKLGENATVQYGYTESACSEKVGPHFLRITDIQNNSVDWECVPFCKIDVQLKTKYSLKPGDIVVARTGATTGKSYLIEDEVDAIFASYLIRVSILDNSALKEHYLYLYFQSQMYWSQITELSSGIAQPGVNGTKLQTLIVPIPQHDEQAEIVRILDGLFAKEQQAKEAAEAVLEKIDLMKKAILARAFRGELGTNDPNDENAVELVKKIV